MSNAKSVSVSVSVLKPSRRAKPGADVRSSERACRSEFERPSEAAKRNVREPEDSVRHSAFSLAASASC